MSSKSTTIVNLILVLFISLLTFSIGTFVGKKYSDNQHQLAALEPGKTGGAHGERQVASVNDGHGTAAENKGGAMSDEEIAKLAEEFVADDEATPAAHGDAHGAPATATTATGHGDTGHGTAAVAPATTHNTETKAPVAAARTSTEPSAVAKDLAHGKTPAATTTTATAPKKATTENRIPAALPKDVAQYAVGKFTVQIAAYPEEAEAQKAASDLKNKGYSAFYIPANVKGKTWYRVSVGQFATQKEAQTYRTEFMANAKVTSAIVQKISVE